MEKLAFELTNEQRKYLGLIPVQENWELVKLGSIYVYFDGDTIRKKIVVGEGSYHEEELAEKTTENRTILLPKTSKGKPKKLNYTASLSFSPFGVYFSFSTSGYLIIANYTTQTTYFSDTLGADKNYGDLENWLQQWIADSTADDIKEIEAFKNAERQHCKFKEGDFFTFKIGRRQWGFGRILLDIPKRKKTPEYKKHKHYGLSNLMGKALVVKVYHKISNSTAVDLKALAGTMALPAQAVMDNHFYYGEKKIIGHLPLADEESDMLISYGRSISSHDKSTVYLQYGLIYKETTIDQFSKYLIDETTEPHNSVNPYRNEGIGYGLSVDRLEQCISEQSNHPFWAENNYSLKRDLRNPLNKEIRTEIFSFFGLDAAKSYSENLKLAHLQQ